MSSHDEQKEKIVTYAFCTMCVDWFICRPGLDHSESLRVQWRAKAQRRSTVDGHGVASREVRPQKTSGPSTHSIYSSPDKTNTIKLPGQCQRQCAHTKSKGTLLSFPLKETCIQERDKLRSLISGKEKGHSYLNFVLFIFVS